eukprot:scaffold95038_cov16-Prasinocladus_malaysianus.AAC.4
MLGSSINCGMIPRDPWRLASQHDRESSKTKHHARDGWVTWVYSRPWSSTHGFETRRLISLVFDVSSIFNALSCRTLWPKLLET